MHTHVLTAGKRVVCSGGEAWLHRILNSFPVETIARFLHVIMSQEHEH